jgi:hypothetical protein
MRYTLLLGANWGNFAVTVGEFPAYWDQTQARRQQGGLEGLLTPSPISETKRFEEEMNELRTFAGEAN